MKIPPQSINWLYENGGAVIRYRTAVELTDRPSAYHLGELERNLLEDPTVKACLEQVQPNTGFTGIHGGKDNAFENSAGRLLNLGCRAGMQPFDDRMNPFRDWLSAQVAVDRVNMGWDFNRTQVAALLAMAGYQDEAVVRTINSRLERIAEFTRQENFDIYIDPAGYPAFPSAYRGRNFLDPRLYPREYLRLPTIHDIYAFAHAPWIAEDPETQAQLDSILEYIASPEYQRLRVGNSIILSEKGHYYSLGWDVTLPGYWGFDSGTFDEDMLVLRVELAAHFPRLHDHPWMQGALAHLEGFSTANGTYRFPRTYLKESTGYWVTGAHMGLGEDRRKRNWLELESTFWMEKILRLVGKI